MKVLLLCFFAPHKWPDDWIIESHDLKTGSDVLNLPDDYSRSFDLCLASPPCDQFTKANSQRWEPDPVYFVRLARKCFYICVNCRHWLFENPPGRIESFIPSLSNYRLLTWRGNITNKEYVLYGNVLILQRPVIGRFGKKNIAMLKSKREAWQHDLVENIVSCLDTLV